jgi:integrase/recombinase XerD
MYVPALRVSEAINIRVRDLNIENQCVDIFGGKGYDTTEMRRAPCDAATLRKIIRYAEHHNLKQRDFIMFSNKSDKAHRSQVYRVLQQISTDSGIDKKTGTHTLRRSRAEHLLDAGLPLTYVSKFLRHKNLSTTMKYLDVSVSDIQKEMQKIQDPIGMLI